MANTFDDPELQSAKHSAPPFRQLEIFHAVMTTHSVTAAARLLNVSQPSLSRSLKRLEDQLKVPLFLRQRRRLLPTAEAVRLFAEVDGVMRQIRALSGSIARIADGQSSLFRFGATASVSRALVPRAIRRMTATRPSLQIFLDALTLDQFIDYLLTGPGECGVTLMEVRHPLIASRSVGSSELVALLPSDHPLTRKDVIAQSDLSGVDLIGFERNGPHSIAIAAYLSGLAVPPRIRVVVRFSEAAATLAGEGVGIALVDGFSAQHKLPDGLVMRPLQNAPVFTARLHWNRERPLSRYVKLLGEALAAAAGTPRDIQKLT